MNLINEFDLGRGTAFLDMALANRRKPFNPTLPELIGIVAAYIGRGRNTRYLGRDLGKFLRPENAERVADTFHCFNGTDGAGLWEQGPAIEDIRFTNEKLDALYPHVNAKHRSLFGDR